MVQVLFKSSRSTNPFVCHGMIVTTGQFRPEQKIALGTFVPGDCIQQEEPRSSICDRRVSASRLLPLLRGAIRSCVVFERQRLQPESFALSLPSLSARDPVLRGSRYSPTIFEATLIVLGFSADSFELAQAYSSGFPDSESSRQVCQQDLSCA